MACVRSWSGWGGRGGEAGRVDGVQITVYPPFRGLAPWQHLLLEKVHLQDDIFLRECNLKIKMQKMLYFKLLITKETGPIIIYFVVIK